MRRYRLPFVLSAAVIAVALISLFQPESVDAEVENDKVRTVIKGDTLWDISEHYLGNPFLWPKLWQWNDFITNPHFIYPGDRIKLYPPKILVKHPPKKVVEEELPELIELEEVPAEAVEETEEAPEKRYTFTELRSSGLVSSEEMKSAGKILEAEDEKVMLSEGDLIYVTLKDNGRAGDLYTIFKTEEKIVHPVSGNDLGFKVKTLGTIELTGFSGEVATARIIDSFDAISRGDLITQKEDIPESITLKASKTSQEGYIVAGREDRVNFGQGDIVYIDRGRRTGVETGNTFVVYHEGEKVENEESKQGYTLPPTTIGRLIVLHVKENTSVAIIVDSVEEMKVGEKIKTEQM